LCPLPSRRPHQQTERDRSRPHQLSHDASSSLAYNP
jgi:hypothetical protein